MKMLREVLTNIGHEVSPENLRIVSRFNTVYSEICIAEIRRSEHETTKIVVKICRTMLPEEVTREFEYMCRFSGSFLNNRIKVPSPLGVDSRNRALVLEYVDGTNLKRILQLPRKDKRVDDAIDLAATALAGFHRMPIGRNDDYHSTKSPYLESDLRLGEIDGIFEKCGMSVSVKSFIDFSVWNIVLENSNGERLFLIDFPGNDCTSMPHIDLARFRYSLKVAKRHPMARFLCPWWNVESVFSEFLAAYCRETRMSVNKNDFDMISWFEYQYARKLKHVYREGRGNLRLLLEGLYMTNTINDMMQVR